MWQPMWLRVFEAWAVARLLSSPSFHRTVHNVHRSIRRIRYGTPMEEMGGTNVERPSLLKYFKDEIKEQLKGGKSKQPPRQL
ncbi:hypothetical protein V2W45_1470931 [Cenococcum geophilum]